MHLSIGGMPSYGRFPNKSKFHKKTAPAACYFLVVMLVTNDMFIYLSGFDERCLYSVSRQPISN